MKFKLAIKQIAGIVRDRSERDITPSKAASSAFIMSIDEKKSLNESLCQRCEPLSMQETSLTPRSITLLPVSTERLGASWMNQAAASMYNCVVALPHVSQDGALENFVFRTSLSVLYNLAFIHHWRAVYLGVSSGIPKALHLYSMALKVISPEENSPDIDHLAMAIWNNMGHIYSKLLYQLREAQVCFGHLRHILAHRTGLRCMLPKRDYETFVLSVMFQASDLLLAPAA